MDFNDAAEPYEDVIHFYEAALCAIEWNVLRTATGLHTWAHNL